MRVGYTNPTAFGDNTQGDNVREQRQGPTLRVSKPPLGHSPAAVKWESQNFQAIDS